MGRIDRRQALWGAGAAALGALTACGGASAKAPVASSGTKTPKALKPSAAKKRAMTLTAEENSKPGDPRWRIDRVGGLHEIEGWADRTSVKPGEHVGLHISTTAATYRVSAIRTGWYAGCQGRQVWRSETLKGQVGEQPRIIGPTNTVVTDWPVSLTIDTTGWTPGFYSFRLDADTGGQRYIPLTVRSGDANGKIVLINGDTTWQAYNVYGGYSLYMGPNGAYATRAKAVTFDRPYGGNEGGQGDSEFQANLLPLLTLVERLGLPAEYLSDTDLHNDPHALDGALAVLSPGHDEYYSTVMRERLQAARDKGTNLAFLGANAIYRHIRLGSSDVGANRLQTCYKEPQEDPLFGHDNSEVTGQWRYDPDPRPESVLTGVFYESNPVKADMVIRNPGHWLFAGAGVVDGAQLPGLVGGEYDRVNLAVPTPRPIEVLARSPLVCNGRSSYSDMAYYTTPSGAGVLSTGTNWWINAMAGASGLHCHQVTYAVTSNMLRVFANGPAGHQHPAIDNATALRT
ncbi:MAG TPA: N,N-dimethylformamidase beta subunit family domain-containing protein [Frankiaceae bacterium]|jgi:hypothetical protein|nr:N,N-dimethylformamidase beta subunit family domain-containing protein [Frankiaceae bacterium]